MLWSIFSDSIPPPSRHHFFFILFFELITLMALFSIALPFLITQIFPLTLVLRGGMGSEQFDRRIRSNSTSNRYKVLRNAYILVVSKWFYGFFQTNLNFSLSTKNPDFSDFANILSLSKHYFPIWRRYIHSKS